MGGLEPDRDRADHAVVPAEGAPVLVRGQDRLPHPPVPLPAGGQEAFVKGWSRRRQLDRDGQPEAWIRTVAWRLAVSRWRGRRRAADAWRRSGVPPHAEAPGTESVALVEALRGLPPKQRRTLALHYVCDLTVEQIAAETGLSASTVKTHLARGRATLSHRLQDPRTEEGPRA
ncbi:sigma-70 family RNA polymerase sigma factor [Streptomyces sp. sk2.1]|nr:sigma-70 family RNA polymerase sigma factor [Streptomyces sp. sk2.1]